MFKAFDEDLVCIIGLSSLTKFFSKIIPLAIGSAEYFIENLEAIILFHLYM